MNRIIYVDMDGVLCDFEAAMDRGRKARPDILYPLLVPFKLTRDYFLE